MQQICASRAGRMSQRFIAEHVGVSDDIAGRVDQFDPGVKRIHKVPRSVTRRGRGDGQHVSSFRPECVPVVITGGLQLKRRDFGRPGVVVAGEEVERPKSGIIRRVNCQARIVAPPVAAFAIGAFVVGFAADVLGDRGRGRPGGIVSQSARESRAVEPVWSAKRKPDSQVPVAVHRHRRHPRMHARSRIHVSRLREGRRSARRIVVRFNFVPPSEAFIVTDRWVGHRMREPHRAIAPHASHQSRVHGIRGSSSTQLRNVDRTIEVGHGNAGRGARGVRGHVCHGMDGDRLAAVATSFGKIVRVTRRAPVLLHRKRAEPGEVLFIQHVDVAARQ